MKPLGIYIHIPFCIKKCNYCDFYSISGNTDAYSHYIKAVKNSIDYWKNIILNRPIDTIYIGGGTPSLLGTKLLSELISSIKDTFSVQQNAEITIEANPNSVLTLDLKHLVSIGLNRISMGLQSTNEEELKLLGRSHNHTDTCIAIEHIKDSGISNFSLDVMQGIPLQTINSLEKTLDFCIGTGATHISTYMLKIEKNTPFYHNRNNLMFADEDTVAQMYEFTCDKLKSNGFRHYEISNFCKSNNISRHNMKYWTLEDYIGVGPSAHSLLEGKRFYYTHDLKSFEKNELTFESEGNTLDEYVMLSLRTDNGLDIVQLQEYIGSEVPDKLLNVIYSLQKSKLLCYSDNKITLTSKGYLLSNSIISRIIDCL